MEAFCLPLTLREIHRWPNNLFLQAFTSPPPHQLACTRMQQIGVPKADTMAVLSNSILQLRGEYCYRGYGMLPSLLVSSRSDGMSLLLLAVATPHGQLQEFTRLQLTDQTPVRALQAIPNVLTCFTGVCTVLAPPVHLLDLPGNSTQMFSPCWWPMHTQSQVPQLQSALFIPFLFPPHSKL